MDAIFDREFGLVAFSAAEGFPAIVTFARYGWLLDELQAYVDSYR